MYELSSKQQNTLSQLIRYVLDEYEEHMEFINPTCPHDAQIAASLATKHDVLEMHLNRNNPDMRDIQCVKPRTWLTELDVPADTYTHVITTLKTERQSRLRRLIQTGCPDRLRVKMHAQINLLNELNTYRQK